MPLKTKLITAPTLEPVTLAEMEMHLRIESNDTASALAQTQSIGPGAHVVAPAYSLEGTGVDVLNYGTVFYVSSGTNGASGTVDVKIQESDDDVTYTDWTGGAFDQITTANDNTTYEKEYTGIKQYVRAVASVLVATCSFGVNIVTSAPESVEDDYITSLEKTARKLIEYHNGRNLITQTWELYLDSFPTGRDIEKLTPPLQSITSIKYYDADDTEATFSSDYYNVGTRNEPGIVRLKSGYSWPSTTLRTLDGVIVQFVSGFGDAADDVDDNYKQAIKILAAELYEHREATDFRNYNNLPWGVKALIGYNRIIPI